MYSIGLVLTYVRVLSGELLVDGGDPRVLAPNLTLRLSDPVDLRFELLEA
jgi:hypothetical protein